MSSYIRQAAWALTLLVLLLPFLASAQTLTGRVMDQEKHTPLIGASVLWVGTTQATSTDADGFFTFTKIPSGATALLISYIGYKPDTVTFQGQQNLMVHLKSETALQEVTITGKQDRYSAMTPTNSQVITAKDLLKSACCNLAESFETNASVEVSTTDAVSGAKQIQMLGLDGAYTLLTIENVPSLRGLATPYRLNYLSGTYIDAIDIIKGTGSVLNGYESISGQVNVRLKDPEKTDRLHVNLYGNSLAKWDANVNTSFSLNKKISSVLMLHTDQLSNRVDGNNDGFLDLPLGKHYNVFNKWKYNSGGPIISELGVQLLTENRIGGQKGFRSGMPQTEGNFYGTESETDRVSAYSKTSYTFKSKPYQSIGLILSGTNHQFDSHYGPRTYFGEQNSGLANLIFQSAFGNTAHTYKTGLSYQYEDYDETLAGKNYTRRELVPGAFFEYVYQNSKNLTLVGGLRADYHNLYGWVFTPRFNVKYDFTPNTILRLAAGKGFRVANPIAENVGSLVSNREFMIPDNLRPEKAWNVGGSFTQYFTLGERTGAFITDYYYTTFQNQVVPDMYSSPNMVIFTNLNGRSFSKSFQAEVQYELTSMLDVKAAYKYFDVRTSYNGQLLQRPFIPNQRAFLNLGFATPFDKWRADLTAQWFGQRTVPVMEHYHEGPIKTRRVSPYAVFNAQVTRAFKQWELYLGGENLLGYKQKNPIIAADRPFSQDFDASMIWAPITGRVIYAGLRFTIK
ncbi:TonB-dependent receptor [Rufibacter quisquiliarum]|uniref:Outer membrane receptor for ferrienterochelin and colicin n=1 Tax=Rufibacter quisquiliarum TaxID=1549639 RepID=A0A839GNB0_9BACT|nr:TonB-dependent receptor [Rufibacter quisquiliarum]MBA9076407.1 outer membrane receptor for ferrienterochelin and colicin [Rufibacter quisquiliarum]